MSFAAARSNAPLAGAIVDPDQLRGGARLLEGLGDDERDRLVVVLDLGAAEQLARCCSSPLRELAGVLRRDDREHAGRGLARLSDRSTRCGPWRSPAPTT